MKKPRAKFFLLFSAEIVVVIADRVVVWPWFFGGVSPGEKRTWKWVRKKKKNVNVVNIEKKRVFPQTKVRLRGIPSERGKWNLNFF